MIDSWLLDAHRRDTIVVSSTRHHCWDQQRAHGSVNALNSYAGLVQLQWQQKTWCNLSTCLGRLTIHVLPRSLHIFCFHDDVTTEQADLSFVVAFGNFSYISLLRCSNYRDMSAMSATFSLCAAPCFTKKQQGDSIKRGCLKYVYNNTTGFFHPHSSSHPHHKVFSSAPVRTVAQDEKHRVNVWSNAIYADFSFYYCVYSVLSHLSRIVPNNGDSHKSSMHQNVQTCMLEVNSTRIGIKLPVDIVYCVRSLLPHALDFKHASQ